MLSEYGIRSLRDRSITKCKGFAALLSAHVLTSDMQQCLISGMMSRLRRVLHPKVELFFVGRCMHAIFRLMDNHV